MPKIDNSTEAARIIKQLQAFDPEQLSNELNALPNKEVEVKFKDTKKGANVFREATITIKNLNTLKKLNYKKYLRTASKDTIEAVELLKRYSKFEPGIINSTKNLLPDGMIQLPQGLTRTDNDNQGINFQFNFRKLANKEYWTPVIER